MKSSDCCRHDRHGGRCNMGCAARIRREQRAQRKREADPERAAGNPYAMVQPVGEPPFEPRASHVCSTNETQFCKPLIFPASCRIQDDAVFGAWLPAAAEPT
ncbi:hypothetical protein PQR02_05680 [Paraburkholderia sediminicola]|uniref:Uncharacterized protein n=1 Tax=Paraburkholderia rhynchosiae TaxID=487049 RepID=A0ACC7N765_9BURK